jgi:hypothetical protein
MSRSVRYVNEDNDPIYTFYYKDFEIECWLVIDGVEYMIVSVSDEGSVSFQYTKTVSGLSDMVHEYYLKIAYRHTEDANYTRYGKITGDTVSTSLSTFVELSGGTLNYMAVGE